MPGCVSSRDMEKGKIQDEDFTHLCKAESLRCPMFHKTSKGNKKRGIQLQRIRFSVPSLEWPKSLGPKPLCDDDTGLARMESELC